jgi:hypothetical protein
MMDPVVVTVQGSLTVPVKVDALSLVLEVDPAMHREITDEAIRTAVSDRLGGFRGVDVVRFASQQPSSPKLTPGETLTAKVDFDGLARCISQLVNAFDSLVDGAEALEAPLQVLELADATAEQRADAVKQLRELVIAMRSVAPSVPEPAAAHEAPPAATNPAAAAREGDGEAPQSGDDGGDSESAEREDYDAERAGYAPLLGSDNDDDNDVGGETGGNYDVYGDDEDGDNGGPPPLEAS